MKLLIQALLLVVTLGNSYASESLEKSQHEDWVNLPVKSIEVDEENPVVRLHTPIYDYVELDCRGIVGALNFVYQSELEQNLHVDNYQCEGLLEVIPDIVKNSSLCLKYDIVNLKYKFIEEKCD